MSIKEGMSQTNESKRSGVSSLRKNGEMNTFSIEYPIAERKQ